MQLLNIGLYSKLKRQISSYLYGFSVLKSVRYIYSIPMSRNKGKNIQTLMVSDNTGSADFHVFSWYFVIESLFLLTKLNHLVPERKGQFVLLNQNFIKQKWH